MYTNITKFSKKKATKTKKTKVEFCTHSWQRHDSNSLLLEVTSLRPTLSTRGWGSSYELFFSFLFFLQPLLWGHIPVCCPPASTDNVFDMGPSGNPPVQIHPFGGFSGFLAQNTQTTQFFDTHHTPTTPEGIFWVFIFAYFPSPPFYSYFLRIFG